MIRVESSQYYTWPRLAISNCSIAGWRAAGPGSQAMTSASSWDLWKLFLSAPVVITVLVGIVLAICLYVDHLLELDGSGGGGGGALEVGEDPTGKQALTAGTSTDVGTGGGAHPGASSEPVVEVEKEVAEEELEDEDEEEYPLIALGPLYSWLMEENVLFQIFQSGEEETSVSEPAASGGRSERKPGGNKVASAHNPPEKSDVTEEKSINTKAKEFKTSAIVSYGGNNPTRLRGQAPGNGGQTPRTVSPLTDREVSPPVSSSVGQGGKTVEQRGGPNRGGHTASTTATGKVQANDGVGKIQGKFQASNDVGKIQMHETTERSAAFQCRRTDVSVGSGWRECTACDVTGCVQRDAHNSKVSTQCDVCGCGYRPQCHATCNEFRGHWDAAGVHRCETCAGLQKPGVCQGDDSACTDPSSQQLLLVELETERRIVESLTLQLARKTLDLRRVQERNLYLEDAIKRLGDTREEDVTPRGGTTPQGPRCDCSREMNPRTRPSCGWIMFDADKDPKHVVAQTSGKKEQVERHAEQVGCQVERGHGGTKHGRCQAERGTCHTEQFHAELSCCQQERGACQVTKDSCHTDRQYPMVERQGCVEQVGCHNEQGPCSVEPRREEQGKCQKERRLCQLEQKDCQTEEGKCQKTVEGRCLAEQRKCRVKQRRCQAEQRKCQLERKRCLLEKRKCQVERRQCQAELRKCQIERGSYQMEQTRRHNEQINCLVDQEQRQAEQTSNKVAEDGQCQKEQRRSKTEIGRCQTEPLGLFGGTETEFLLEPKVPTTEHNSCKPEPDWRPLEPKLLPTEHSSRKPEPNSRLLEPKVLPAEHSSRKLEPDYRLLEPKVLLTEHSSRKLETDCHQQEQKLAKTEPSCDNNNLSPSQQNANSLHPKHLTSALPDSKTAAKNENKIAPHGGVQNDGVRNPRVEASPKVLFLASCDTLLHNNCPRTLAPVQNPPTLRGSTITCDSGSGSGVRGTSNPYDTDDGPGSRGTHYPYDPTGRARPRRTSNPYEPHHGGAGQSGMGKLRDPDGEAGLRGAGNTGNTHGGKELRESSNTGNPHVGKELRENSNTYLGNGPQLINSYDTESGVELRGTSNNCSPDSGAGIGGTSNTSGKGIPHDPNGGAGSGRTTNHPYNRVRDVGISETINPYDPDGRVGTFIRPSDPEVGLGGSSNTESPESRVGIGGTTNRSDLEGGAGLGGSSNPCNPERGAGLAGSSNTDNPESGAGLGGSSNTDNPESRVGLGGSSNPCNPESGAGLGGSSNTGNSEGGAGIGGAINPCNTEGGVGPDADFPAGGLSCCGNCLM